MFGTDIAYILVNRIWEGTMKNLFLLMTAILLVNVSVYAEVNSADLGNTDDKADCSMISGEMVKNVEGSSDSQDGNQGSDVRA